MGTGERRLVTAWRRIWSHGVWPALGFAPVIALCLGFMLRGGGDLAADGVAGMGMPDLARVIQLILLDVVTGHDAREVVVSIGLVGLLYLAARTLMRDAAAMVNAGLFVFVGFLLLYLSIPFQFDVRWMPTRLMPYVLFGALFWIAGMTRELPRERCRRITGAIVICAAALTVVGTGIRMHRWAEIDGLLTEYMSGIGLIEPNSTLLALRLSAFIDGRTASDEIEIMLQMPGYIAAQRGVVDLKHFQAQTGSFALTFREELNPYRHLAADRQFVRAPETIRPSDYTENTGQAVDYVLLWGEAEALPPDSPLAADLDDAYDLIHVSPDRGLARLYQRREP